MLSLNGQLLKLDSIYSNFSKAAELKYQTGESNLLEKTTAQTQAMEIQNKLRLMLADVAILKSQLNVLLNTEEQITVSKQEAVKKEITVSLDTGSAYANNPALAYLQQEIVIQQGTKALENSKLLPDFTIGYFNQSLIGGQANNGNTQYYDSGDRFSGFQVGIAIPLWFRPHTAKVQAAKVRTEIAESNFEQYQKSLGGRYQQAIQEHNKYKSDLSYYEESALIQADLILKNAQEAFKNGTVGYVEYVQGINQATQIQTNWLETLSNYNQAIIQLEFLAGIK